MRALLSLLFCRPLWASEWDVNPAAPPPPPFEATEFTMVTFTNVAPCTTIQAVKFRFKDGLAPGSGIHNLCPRDFRTSAGYCEVPGPFGKSVGVEFKGRVTSLDITLLDPGNEDENVTAATRVYLDAGPGQMRNFITTSLTQSSNPGDFYLADDQVTLIEECNFEVSSLTQPDIPAGHFRISFIHYALGLGEVKPYSNGDGLLGSLQPHESLYIDHRLMGEVQPWWHRLGEVVGDIGVSFVTETGGTIQMDTGGTTLSQAPWILSQSCELSAITFFLYGAPDVDVRAARPPRITPHPLALHPAARLVSGG